MKAILFKRFYLEVLNIKAERKLLVLALLKVLLLRGGFTISIIFAALDLMYIHISLSVGLL
jgi:hypothetical protein